MTRKPRKPCSRIGLQVPRCPLMDERNQVLSGLTIEQGRLAARVFER